MKLAKKRPEMVVKWPNPKVVSFESKRSIFCDFINGNNTMVSLCRRGPHKFKEALIDIY